MKTQLALILTLLLGVNTSLNAQEASRTYHKNIYVELLGSSLLAGANFDMRLRSNRIDGIGFRAGIGGLPSSMFKYSSLDVGVVTFPLELNNVVGKNRNSFISGIGILPAYATASGTHNGDLIQEDGFGLLGGFFNLGYRLQPKRNGGFMMQATWNPIILNGHGLRLGWIGLGFGIGFK